MLTTFEHCFEACAKCECRFSSSGATTHRDDSDFLVEQHFDCEPLFCASAVQTKHIAVTWHEFDFRTGFDATQRAAALRVNDQPSVDWQLGDAIVLNQLGVVEVVDLVTRESNFGDASPARVGGDVVAILLGVHSERGSFHAHRQVFRNHGHVETFAGQVECAGKNARVVVAQLHAAWQNRLIDVV